MPEIIRERENVTRLSTHFTLCEATQSQVAMRAGIDNTPPLHLMGSLIRTSENLLEPSRQYFGIPFSPSSWYRCLELNRLLGSSDESQHPKGLAVDWEIPTIPNIEVAKFIERECDFDQLILEFWNPSDPSSGWVHASYVSAVENRREVLRFDGTSYLPGLE